MSELAESMAPPLPASFYAQPTLTIARELLGKSLWRRTADGIASGVIVETEAYISAIDPASHNYRRPSPRSTVMFGPPGRAYVYLIYGLYHCLNVVTEPAGSSAAVLIRALAPTAGLELMVRRCPPGRKTRDLARGPGRLCQALDITLAQNGVDLTGDILWISETPGRPALAHERIITATRIGISLGQDLPWRFFVEGEPAVSRGQSRMDSQQSPPSLSRHRS